MRHVLLGLPFVACVTAPTPPAPDPAPPGSDGGDRVTVAFSSEVQAEVEPCG